MPFSSFDSNRDLPRALANLKTFSQQLEKEPFPNLSHLDVREGQIVARDGSLGKVMSLAYNIVGLEAKEKDQKVLTEIEQSIDVVDRCFHLLQSMEYEGDAEQQRFAAYAMQEIARFNKIIDQTAETPPTLTGRIAHFIYRQSGLLIGKKLKKIQIPQLPVRKIDFPQRVQKPTEPLKISTKMNSEATAASFRIASLHEAVMPGWQVSRQTLELYAMKAIALLEQHALTHQEARAIVDKTSKEMHVNRQEKLLTISQHLKPEPGKTVHITLSFRADPFTSAFTIPVPPFYMAAKSEQNGFPHPLQHHGWALSDFLIPSVVYVPEELPTLYSLINMKAKIAKNLLPEGKYVEIARDLLRKKRKAFSKNYHIFAPLHKELMIAIVESAKGKPLSTEKYKEIFSDFFEAAASTVSPYDYIADANQLVIECITDRPKKSLEKYWLEESEGSLLTIEVFKSIFEGEYKKSLQEFVQKKEKTENEKEKTALEYIIELSRLLFPSAEAIFLQHYSKVLNCNPLGLDDFSKKLQISLYNQLEEFQKEIVSGELHKNTEEHLEKLLKKDIEIFQAKEIDSLLGKPMTISKELHNYYSGTK